MRIHWSPLSIDRIAEIVDTMARDNPRAAERRFDDIFAKVEKLRSFPEIGHEKIRELINTHYRIIYKVHPRQISILTVRHGKQLLPSGDIPT